MKSYERNFKYTKDDLIFIAYNNRSLTNVVQNFLPRFNISNILHFQKVEKDFANTHSIFDSNRGLELDISELELDAPDFFVTPQDIKDRTQLLLDAHNNLSGTEYEYLKNRGITDEIIDRGKLGSLSYIKDIDDLNILGATTHPIMNKMFDGGLIGGGITIPLFDKNNDLVNVTFRKISNYNKLKYTHSCPDVFVWGLDDIELGDTVWLVEGVFDKYALETQLPNSKIICTSSGSISPIQIWKIITKHPGKVNFICDNDQVGFRTGIITQKIFRINKIECQTYFLEGSKDANEHILEKKKTIEDLLYVEINKELIQSKGTEYEERIPMNFFNYLKTRKF